MLITSSACTSPSTTIWVLSLPWRTRLLKQLGYGWEPTSNKAASSQHHPYCHQHYYHPEISASSERAPSSRSGCCQHVGTLPAGPSVCPTQSRCPGSEHTAVGSCLGGLMRTHIWGWFKESWSICKPEAPRKINWSSCKGRRTFPFLQE